MKQRPILVSLFVLSLAALVLAPVVPPEPSDVPLSQSLPDRFQFATSLYYGGEQENIPALIETDGQTIRLVRTLARDVDDPLTYYKEADWGPEGIRLVYMDALAGDTTTHIYLTAIDADAGLADAWADDPIMSRLLASEASVRLTPDDGIDHYEAAFSPDGSRIAYYGMSGTSLSDIYVMNSDGSDVVRVTTTPDLSEHAISWSPDSQWLAFAADIDGTSQIFMVPAAGGEPTQITTAGPHKYSPIWFPSGERLYFASKPEEGAVGYIQSISITGNDVFTHHEVLPDILGADAFVDSMALHSDGEVLAYIRAQLTFSSPEIAPEITSSLHLLTLDTGDMITPVWDGDPKPALIGLKWRMILPHVP